MFLQFSELLPSEVHRWRWPGQPQNVRSSVIGWARRRARILTNQKMAFSCIHHRRWEKEKSLLCFSNFSLHRRLRFLKLNIYKIMILRLWKVCCSWILNDYDANSEALRSVPAWDGSIDHHDTTSGKIPRQWISHIMKLCLILWL